MTPALFRVRRSLLEECLGKVGRARVATGLATVFTAIGVPDDEADRLFGSVLAPLLRRNPAELRERLPIGPLDRCLEILGAYRDAGVDRVNIVLIGDPVEQVSRIAEQVEPALTG